MRCIMPTSGNLDRRGIGDIETLTVREYLALRPAGRLSYRIYRHPLVMFGVGPGLCVPAAAPPALRPDARGLAALAQHHGDQRRDRGAHRRAVWLIGFGPFLLVHLPIVLLAASMGVWLFYVQHQFEETLWDDDGLELARSGAARQFALRLAAAAALVHRQYRRPPRTSSVQPHPLLPAAARAARSIRSWRRRPAYAAGKPHCVRLALWDEDGERLVSFRQLRRMQRAA